jgi:hypothetical protein
LQMIYRTERSSQQKAKTAPPVWDGTGGNPTMGFLEGGAQNFPAQTVPQFKGGANPHQPAQLGAFDMGFMVKGPPPLPKHPKPFKLPAGGFIAPAAGAPPPGVFCPRKAPPPLPQTHRYWPRVPEALASAGEEALASAGEEAFASAGEEALASAGEELPHAKAAGALVVKPPPETPPQATTAEPRAMTTPAPWPPWGGGVQPSRPRGRRVARRPRSRRPRPRRPRPRRTRPLLRHSI